MNTFFKVIGMGFIAVIVVCVFAVIVAFPVMWLWNWLMPSIFGLPNISSLQALGLMIISGFLFRFSFYSDK